jgi:hypothetical protein
MTATRLHPRALLGLAAVAVVWSAAATLARTIPHEVVAIAAMIDVTLTSVLALYFIAVRPGHLPAWTLTVTAAAGLAFARLVFANGPDVANAAIAAGIALELGAMVLFVIRFRRARGAWRVARTSGATRADALDAAFGAAGMPRRLAAVLATELALLSAAVTGWRRPTVDPRRFTVHRANGLTLYVGVFVALIVVEAAGLHLLFTHLDWTLLAWLSTGSSIYAAMWLLGDAHALRHSGITVHDDVLDLAIGVRWRGRVPRADIASVERGAPSDRDASVVRIAVLEPNLVLRLHAPCELRGLLGRRRTAHALALSVDEPDRFLAALRAVP